MKEFMAKEDKKSITFSFGSAECKIEKEDTFVKPALALTREQLVRRVYKYGSCLEIPCQEDEFTEAIYDKDYLGLEMMRWAYEEYVEILERNRVAKINEIAKEMVERLDTSKDTDSYFEVAFPAVEEFNCKYPQLELRLIFRVISENLEKLQADEDLGMFFDLYAEVVTHPFKEEKPKMCFNLTELAFTQFDGYLSTSQGIKDVVSCFSNRSVRVLNDEEAEALNLRERQRNTFPDIEWANLMAYLTSEKEAEHLRDSLEDLDEKD